MPTLEEVGRNFDALGSRVKQIWDSCMAALSENLDDVLASLGPFGNANGFWGRLYEQMREEHKKIYPSPEQEGVRTAADNYASGVIQRLKERILFGQHNELYIEFFRKHHRFPEPGDHLYRREKA